MVGHAAGRRIMRLGDVKPVHRLTRLADAAARHEAAHLVEPAEGRIEKIAVDGENFVRAAEIGNYDSVCTEARGNGGIGFIRAERFVFGPEQVREFLTKLPEQTVPRGRGVAFGEEGQTGTPVGRGRGGDFVEFGAKRGGIALCPGRLDRFRTVRIVEVEDRSLRKGVRAAIADRVQRVAFQFGRTPVTRRGDERHGAVAARHGRRVVEEFARDGPLGALREGHEIRLGAAATGQADAGQGHRAAHELEKIAARQFAAMPLGCALREFAFEFFREVGRGRQFVEAAPKRRTLFAGGMGQDAFHVSDGRPRIRRAG